MFPKKKMPPSCGIKRLKITVEQKREIIAKREKGISVSDLSREYNRTTSTICTILKNKDKIKEMDGAKGVTRITTKRMRSLVDVERLLLIWINEKQLQGDSLSRAVICEKAKQIYEDLSREAPAASSVPEEAIFRASSRWYEKFKKNFKPRHLNQTVQSSGSNSMQAELFVDELKKLIDAGSYLPQQVFSCDETVLFWKTSPMWIGEDAALDHAPAKDRSTLLFCANASGDFKINPLAIYPTQSDQSLRKRKDQLSQLQLLWTSSNNALLTRDIFIVWMNREFGPSVKKYLQKMNLPLRVLLVMDNVPAHPPYLAEELQEEFKFITIHFLPTHISSLVQPMEQEVFIVFRQLYIKAIFEHCIKVVEDTNLTFSEFWQSHFHIVTSLKKIEKAWQEIEHGTLNKAWRKLWPEIVIKQEYDPIESVTTDIEHLARRMGLDEHARDMEDWINEYSQELTCEDLKEVQQTVVKESISEKGSSHVECDAEHRPAKTIGKAPEQHVPREECDNLTHSNKLQQPSSASQQERESPHPPDKVAEVLQAWKTVSFYVQKHHPHKSVAKRAVDLFDDSVMSHFKHKSLRRRKETNK